MTFLRAHLSLFVWLWLVGQSVSLSAFLPADCCAAHRAAAAETPECHAAADQACEMHAAIGEECPMHAAPAAAADTPTDSDICVMRGLCHAPATALAMLIPMAGVLVDLPPLADADLSVAVADQPARSFIVTLPHDTPPPRL